MITVEQFQKIFPSNKYPQEWTDALNKILPDYEITTERRIAAFLAQTGHESADYTRLKENLKYSAKRMTEVWPSRFPTIASAKPYEYNEEKLANKVYANRMGNGPESSGDGFRFRGRGILQVTGKNNYQTFADYIGASISDIPEYLESFEGAVHSACWFWEMRGLNKYSDSGDLKTQTIKINGGTTGLSDRINRFNKILRIL